MLLYLPLAHNYGRLLHLSARLHRFHDRVPRRPDARRGRAAARAPDALSERAARLREDPRRRSPPGSTRRQASAASWSTGRSASAERVSTLRQATAARPAVRSPGSTASPTGSSTRRSRNGSAAGSGSRTPAARPLSRDVAEFFHSIDILILEGYGLSEVTTAATVNRPEAFKFGTVGKPMPGVELLIRAEDGEILIRSNTVFAGYYRDPEATAEVLDARGLRPHRRCRPSRRGRLPRDHRPQEGHHRHRRRQERRAAEPRERAEDARDRLAGARDRRPPALHRRPDHARSGCRRPTSRRRRSAARSTPSTTAARGFEQIKRFRILPRDFSIEHDELTPTLKIRRKVILEHFAEDVEALYADAD